MITKFEDLKKTDVNGLRGGTGVVTLEKMEELPNHTKMYARIRIPDGSSIGFHTHVDDCEIIYVLEGKAVSIVDGKEYPLEKGMISFTKCQENHQIINNNKEDFVVLAVVNEK